MSVAVPTKDSEFYPFQRIALQRKHTKEQRLRFKQAAINRAGLEVWSKSKAFEKVKHLSWVLQAHEMGVLTCVWQLLRADPEVLSYGLIDNGRDTKNSSYSGSGHDGNNSRQGSMRSLRDFEASINSGDFINKAHSSGGDGANLSGASLDLLEEVFAKGSIRDKLRNATNNSSSGGSGATKSSSGNGSNSNNPGQI
jgi:hypothetical protein